MRPSPAISKRKLGELGFDGDGLRMSCESRGAACAAFSTARQDFFDVLAIPVFILAVAVTWLIAKASGRRDTNLMRLLLLIQFLLITCLLIFSVMTKPSADPRGLMATIAAMIAVTAMGCQFALLRLTLPIAPSTAVMTGNLTNAVLALVDSSSRDHPLMEGDGKRLGGALRLLVGFFVGCVAATAAVNYLGDWAWLLPAVLAAVALS
jgi:uncharacterized membrane protein YoaK (UPF0700 family)